MKKVSIALLNYNGRKYLETFLPSVFQHSDVEFVDICLIDNASIDDSVEYVKNNYPKIKIIQLDKNYGFAGGYNRGLEQLSADYFVLLNTDVEVTGNWLSPIIDFLDSNNDVVACQPKILAYNNKSHFEHAGASGGYIDYLGYPFCRGRLLGTIEEDRGQYDTIVDIFWATGACLFIRSKDFFEMDGFDDDFFAHMEEIDLCWRLKARGKRIVCIPQSIVYHVGGGTLNKENPHKTYLNYRNNLLMIYKNMPKNSLREVLRKRWFLDYLSVLPMLLTGKFANAKAVFCARSDFKKMKKEYKEIRSRNQQETICSVFPEMYDKSLVFDYYILGNKTFSDFSR